MSEAKIKTDAPLAVRIQLKCPQVPNFLTTVSGQVIDIKQVPDGTLRKLGELWTEKLIKHARARKGISDP